MWLLTTLVLASLASRTVGSTCKYIKANANDGCYNLAQRCDITQAKLTEYNKASGSSFCKSIEVGDYVCCSAGSLPDFSPKKNADGSCHSYTVQKDDTCSSIESAKQMKKDTIKTYNNDTWGWAGCKMMQEKQNICLSDGTPPFPSEMDNANCGPQVPGTVKPDDMAFTNWTNLNPCPLNACCDIWGQCGVTSEFCTNSTADTGAPGTAKNGTNGCISNCGTDIVNTDDKPDKTIRIAYFETFNMDRKCMKMDISKIEGDSYYTHIHWAFANITESFTVDVSGYPEQFDGLKKIDGLKRILSFGGWGFSTTEYTYSVLRNGVKESNRKALAKAVVDFINDEELDGIDFDWEYPGAQDIPGIPADSKDSGKNYLEFLKLVKAQLPSSKTLSIAAPASYWYLKNFPIKEISEVVDYIVYMTYDLHGQWDYNSTNADDGCPLGGCLRSQVNQTETHYSLSMITKAGVPSKKVVAGLPLYGRSFKMEDLDCTGPECHFTGPESGATKGTCTDTAGYISNYEIYDIISRSESPELYNVTIQQYEDEGDVLIYDGNWVSWLNAESYAKRREWTDGMNFAGTSDWAVDLNQTYANNGTGDEVTILTGDDYEVCDYSQIYKYKTLDELSAASGDMRSDCIAVYALQTLITMLDTAYDNYTNVNSGYDDLFGYYVTYMEDLVPTILDTELLMAGDGVTTGTGTSPTFADGASYFNCGYEDVSKNCESLNHGNEILPTRKNINWKLTDEDGWDKALANKGISSDYVAFGDYTRHQHHDTVGGRGGVTDYYYYFTNFPKKNESMVVPNPKDIVLKALPHIPSLRSDMQTTVYDMMLGQWFNGSLDDPSQVYSTPVFTIIQAIDGMAQAKKLGEEEKTLEKKEAEEKKKNFILTIISVVLIFVPFVGEEAAAAAGMVQLARSIAIAGEAANVGFAIYDTVDNPKSALINVIGAALGVGSIAKAGRTGEDLAAVAKIRSEMKASEISSMGDLFKANDDSLQSLLKVCRWK
ncbi:glycoside hydrolase [Penicillium tannophilum]|nr:glycoside hydrolase [Penicillium tannophilum]